MFELSVSYLSQQHGAPGASISHILHVIIYIHWSRPEQARLLLLPAERPDTKGLFRPVCGVALQESED